MSRRARERALPDWQEPESVTDAFAELERETTKRRAEAEQERQERASDRFLDARISNRETTQARR